MWIIFCSSYNATELSSIPFCELQKVREKIGTKEFDTLLLNPDSKWHKKHNSPRTVPSSSKRRRVDKSKPLEISSKKRVPYLKKPVPAAEQPSQRPVDPRFNEKCGNLNESLFEKSYHFLSEVRAKEKHLVKQELKKEKDDEKRAELSRLLNKMVFSLLPFTCTTLIWALCVCVCVCACITCVHAYVYPLAWLMLTVLLYVILNTG